MVTIRDAFSPDLYGAIEMTDVINRRQRKVSRVRRLGIFEEVRVATDAIALEAVNGNIQLIQSTPRGGPGVQIGRSKRSGFRMETLRYDAEATITASEIKDVFAVGGNFLKSMESERNDKIGVIADSLDQTEEFVFRGALRGKVLEADGSEAYDLYDLYDLERPDLVMIDSDASTPIKKIASQVKRQINAALGTDAEGGFGIHCFVGDEAWDHITNLAELDKAFERLDNGDFLRNGGGAFSSFTYAGITWENTQGSDDGKIATPTNGFEFFPTGVSGLFKAFYSPSDKISGIGGKGLPRYSWGYPDPRDRFVALEGQMNLLALMHKPLALLQGELV